MGKLNMNLTKNKYLKAVRGSVNDELRDLRGKHFVYFLIKGKRIVYIGSTSDIQRRISQHKSAIWLKKWFTHFRTIQCNSQPSMIKYEKRWISKLKPLHNGGGKNKRPSGSDLPYDEWLRLRNEQIDKPEYATP